MLVPDVNTLLYAFRNDALDHDRYEAWLTDVLDGEELVGISDLALSAVLKISTHPGIYNPPSSTADALVFVDQIRSADNVVPLQPGTRHWNIFMNLCRQPDVRGNLIPDAYFAALAIENNAEWITMDGDFARFEGLHWRRPFDS